MKVIGQLNGMGVPAMIENIPIDGNGSDINCGSLLTPGLTAGQDMSVFILSAADGADAIGILAELHDQSVTGDSAPEDVAAHVTRGIVPLFPGCLVAAEYDQTDTLACTGTSTTAIAVTSLEDDLDGGWMYCVSGTAIGQLAYIKSGDTTGVTVDTLTTAPVTGDTWIKILRPGKTLVKLNTARDKIGTDAGAGSWTARVLWNEYCSDDTGGTWTRLDPTKHSNLQLNGKNAKFRAIVAPVNTYVAPID